MSSKEHVHPTDGGPDGGDGSDCSLAGMMMTFHFGHCETVMFDGWKITDIGTLIGSVIGILCLSAIYEALKYFRECIIMKKYYESVEMATQNTSETMTTTRVVVKSIFHPLHYLQTLLHMIQIVISYFLMLIFMTYNAWLCIAIVVGGGIGYFLVGWKSSALLDRSEHCH